MLLDNLDKLAMVCRQFDFSVTEKGSHLVVVNVFAPAFSCHHAAVQSGQGQAVDML